MDVRMGCDELHHIQCSSISFYISHTNVEYVYIASTILITLSIPVIVLNALIVCVIYRSRSLHTPSNVLLVCTAVIDSIVGCLSMPQWATIYILAFYHKHNCPLFLFSMFTSHCFGLIGFLLAAVVAFDRYVAIFQPYRYEEHVIHNLCIYLKLFAFITFVVSLLTALSFLTYNKLLIEWTILCIGPLLLIVSLYVHARVFAQVKRVGARICLQKPQENKAVVVPIEATSVTNNNNNSSGPDSVTKKLKREVGINRLMFLLLISLSVSYFPYAIVVAMWRLYPPSYTHFGWTHTLYMGAYTVSAVKSFVNPVIFIYRSNALRSGIALTLEKITRKKS